MNTAGWLVVITVAGGSAVAPAQDRPVPVAALPTDRAEANAAQSQRAIQFCRRYAEGWLAHADPVSGLLPRRTSGEPFWNAQDCAADNYPFLVLTAFVTDNHHLKRTVLDLLRQEQRLTNRLDSLPDDFSFATQSLRRRQPRIEQLIFGASEYAKDGLMPIVEWLGPGPWLDRMIGLIDDVWKHAPIATPAGKIPSRNVEVNGELLQTMSRLYWQSGGARRYASWCFRLADHHLFDQPLLGTGKLSLRDHGCEIIGGLSEAYLIAARVDPQRWQRYRPVMHGILDAILEHGVNADGMMHNGFEPKTKKAYAGLSDGFGYVYNAFLTVAEIDGVERYRQAVRHVLGRVQKYRCRDVKGMQGADGHADAIEGALNLLNRIPVADGFAWVDREICYIFDRQGQDGIIEGWYGDGNSARTALMYALWKTQGVHPSPWRDDLRCGAVRVDDGIEIHLASRWAWSGRLRFDRPRHRELLHLPLDYPRINQFPEWFTVESDHWYEVRRLGCQAEVVTGAQLREFDLTLEPGQKLRLRVRRLSGPTLRPGRRTARYTTRSAKAARAWQDGLRSQLRGLLRQDVQSASSLPLQARELSRSVKPGYTIVEVEFQATARRRIKATVALPRRSASLPKPARMPAVVSVHGHGGNRRTVYQDDRIYRRFASHLASRGYVTIAVDVGQHLVQEEQQTLLGERLQDLCRSIDYLESLDNVDPGRIGCAGLSLGGEMCMWLAALDTRVRVTVSAGFLTKMEQMEKNHCRCWDLPGLRELVDYADIYSLVAPRALQCQNGLREGPRDFYVPLARRAMQEIQPIYRDLGVAGRLELAVHPSGHAIDLPALLQFFDAQL